MKSGSIKEIPGGDFSGVLPGLDRAKPKRKRKQRRTGAVVGLRRQGKEFSGTIGAPTEEDLDEMIDGLQEYGTEHGLDPLEVLDKRPDPDGGWEATIRAHNWGWGWLANITRPFRPSSFRARASRYTPPPARTYQYRAPPAPRFDYKYTRGVKYYRPKGSRGRWTRSQQQDPSSPIIRGSTRGRVARTGKYGADWYGSLGTLQSKAGQTGWETWF